MSDEFTPSKWFFFRKSVLLCISFFLISSLTLHYTYANDCVSRSPSYANKKTPNDKLKVRDLTDTEQDLLRNMFQSLSGRWEGNANDTECKGRTGERYKETSTFTIKAEVKTDRNGDLRLESVLYSEEQHTRHSEIIEFFLTDNKLRFDNDSGAGDVEIIDISKNRIKFLKRASMGGGWQNAGPIKRELFITLSKGNNLFTFQMSIYSQGNFVANRIRNYKK